MRTPTTVNLRVVDEKSYQRSPNLRFFDITADLNKVYRRIKHTRQVKLIIKRIEKRFLAQL